MKNVHLITKEQEGADVLHQYLYITSEEAIKEGDWYLIEFNGLKITQCNSVEELISIEGRDDCKKIILTTDQDLIGVQSIDNEFLEWFVKNPSCEEVEIENKKVLVGWEPDYTYEDLGIDGSKNVYHNFYKIILPQEEPKQIKCYCGHTITCDCEPLQETIEEAAKKLYPITGEYFDKEFYMVKRLAFIEGAKWQSERMYSEEDLHNAFYNGWLYRGENYSFPKAKKEWFKQFKKK
jgi:hypothetical protein